MRFRPCIDIHNGKVKQIVGSSLKDEGDFASENFVSDRGASYYAELYKKDNLKGAHVIMLNSSDSDYKASTMKEAVEALKAFEGGLQIGGGINADNAKDFIEKGASHVIVTSYVFKDGRILYENLEKLKKAVGKEHVVIDLSCRKKDNKFYVVTDRWQKFTDEEVTVGLFEKLTDYCDEFLVHGVDVEGKGTGIDEALLVILSDAGKRTDMPITYAGGISSMADIETISKISGNRLNFTVGSKLDLFGGNLSYDVLKEI